MRPSLVLCVALALSGCATPPPEVVEVSVPVPVYCEPPARQRPSLPVDALPEAPDAFELVRALWASLEVLEGYSERLEADTNACRAQVP